MSDVIAEITGKIIDVGNLDEGRGFVLEVNGEDVRLVGLSIEETKAAGALLGESAIITARRAVGKPGSQS